MVGRNHSLLGIAQATPFVNSWSWKVTRWAEKRRRRRRIEEKEKESIRRGIEFPWKFQKFFVPSQRCQICQPLNVLHLPLNFSSNLSIHLNFKPR